RQKEGRDRGDYAHADGAGQGLARDPGSLHQLLRLAQDAASAGEDLLARIGEKYVSAAPVDEDHAEILLEFLDPGAERRLADEAALCRPAEMPFAIEGVEIAKLSHGGQVNHRFSRLT